jgi:hypothetical protein
MVRREDERAASLRAAGAQVVVGDLLEPGDVYRVVSGCSRVYFGMSLSAGYLRFRSGRLRNLVGIDLEEKTMQPRTSPSAKSVTHVSGRSVT